MRVWDLSSGQCRATLPGHTGSVNGVALSGDGRTAVSGSDDNTVRVWDLSSRQCRATLSGHTDQVNSVALSVDGRTVVSGSWDQTVRVWDLSSGQCIAMHNRGSPEAHRAWALVRSAALLIFERATQSVALWSSTGEVLARFPGHFTAADFSRDGRHGIAGDGSGQVYFLRLHRRDG